MARRCRKIPRSPPPVRSFGLPTALRCSPNSTANSPRTLPPTPARARSATGGRKGKYAGWLYAGRRGDHRKEGADFLYWTDLLRASRAACAFFVACDTLPIFAGGTRVRRRRLRSARMPSLGVSPVGGRVGN